MDAITLLTHQLTAVNGLLHRLASDLTLAQWTARPAPEQNRLGFTLWHIPASQDWTVHTWIRNVSEVRDRREWTDRLGFTRLGLAFGIPLDQADAIAQAIGPADTLAYADAVLAETLAWLATLTEADLTRVPDNRAHLTRRRVYQTVAYEAEVKGMWDQTICQLLSGDSGHGRDHLGEARLAKTLILATVPDAERSSS